MSDFQFTLVGDVSRVPDRQVPTRGPGFGLLPAPGPGRTPPSKPGTAEDQEAHALIAATLADWGLESLTDWAYEQVVVNDLSFDYIIKIELPKRDEYKQRFSANELRKKNGLAVLSPEQYIAYEAEVRNQFRLAGLPEGFYDEAKDFETFIAEDVSPAELNARLVEGYRDVQLADPDVRAGFTELYGVSGDAMLLAYFLDPAKALPILEREEAAARVYGQGAKTAYGKVSKAEAERIAALGLTEGGVAEGFSGLVADEALFQRLDIGEDTISREDQLAAAFEGNVAARNRIEARRRKRQAAFSGGGAFAGTREGLGGLGSAAA